MLRITGPEFVLWLHIIAASIWIGGQVTVAVAVTALRHHPGQARGVGHRYQLIAWPAFVVLVLTGIVNVGNAGLQWSHLLDSTAGRTLVVKLRFVGLSGLAAGAHAFIQAPRRTADATGPPLASALLGSASLLAALVAALYGVVWRGDRERVRLAGAPVLRRVTGWRRSLPPSRCRSSRDPFVWRVRSRPSAGANVKEN